MKPVLHNYGKKAGFRGLMPLLPASVLPLALIGYTAKPVFDYTTMAEELDYARARSVHADDLKTFLASFGTDGPPTERIKALEGELVKRLPQSFEATQFYDAALSASRGLDMNLDSIVPTNEVDLRFPVGGLSVFEGQALLKGRGRASDLTAFLADLHRHGRPVCVHACRLNALTNEPGVFDFQLELGVYFLSEPLPEDGEVEEDL